MRETFTSGSVGRAPGNRCLYPEPDCLQRPVRRSSLCNIPIADGKDSEEILGPTADLNPKGRGDKSMPIKPGTAEDAYIVARQDPRDMAKAGLLEVCATSPRAGFSSQRREVRKNRPPGHPTYRMAKALRDHSLLGTREMTGRR